MQPKNGSPEDPLYFETLESTVVFDSHVLQVPNYVAKRRQRRLVAAAPAAGSSGMPTVELGAS